MTHQKGFATLDTETTIDELPVDGTIPEWLAGQLIRNGPAKFEVGDASYRHWFDGLAMLHAFGFHDGRVSYANRFLQSRSYTEAKKEGTIARAEFGTDPCGSVFDRVMQLFTGPEATDNASVNVARIADQFVAMTETPLPVTFDEDLETTGHLQFTDDLDGDMTTAHPHFDARRGQFYNYLSKFGPGSSYQIFGQPADGRRRKLVAELDVDTPRYMHSFGMTRDYLVLVEFPVVFDALEILLSDDPVCEAMKWKPELGTRFRIVDKESGNQIGETTTEPFFAFHHVNAYQDSGRLVVDIAAYDDASVVWNMDLDRLRDGEPASMAARLRRFRLDPDGSNLQDRRLADQPVELPRINYTSSAGRPYRYVWGVSQSPDADFVDEITRIDTTDGTSRTWRQPGCFPGEPVFVARPDAKSEDDGILLSVVLNGDDGRSFLIVLDARTLDEIGRATVPHHIPFGFHGDYFDR